MDNTVLDSLNTALIYLWPKITTSLKGKFNANNGECFLNK